MAGCSVFLPAFLTAENQWGNLFLLFQMSTDVDTVTELPMWTRKRKHPKGGGKGDRADLSIII